MSNDIDMVEQIRYLGLLRKIEDFLYLEANLLDERRYQEWLELLTDDIRYRIPMRKNLAFADQARDITDEHDIAWFDDDKATLAKRVAQIMTGIHWAEEPPSRVSHLVTNIRLENAAAVLAGAQELEVSCRLLVHRNRLEDETDFFIGRRKDILRRDGDSFQLARRTVILDQSTLLAKNITIFI